MSAPDSQKAAVAFLAGISLTGSTSSGVNSGNKKFSVPVMDKEKSDTRKKSRKMLSVSACDVSTPPVHGKCRMSIQRD